MYAQNTSAYILFSKRRPKMKEDRISIMAKQFAEAMANSEKKMVEATEKINILAEAVSVLEEKPKKKRKKKLRGAGYTKRRICKRHGRSSSRR